MSVSEKIGYPRMLLLFLLACCYQQVNAQDSLKAHFKNDSLRLEPGSNSSCDTSVQIAVSRKGFKRSTNLFIKIDWNKSNVDKDNIMLPATNEFHIVPSDGDTILKYKFTVPRNDKDDRNLQLYLEAYDDNSKRIPLAKGDTSIVVYVKPFQSDSLTTSNTWEFWFFTGTNFDFFEGPKAEEFFFRANTLFKINKAFYGQLAFYKNRYFTLDSSTTNTLFERRPLTAPNDSVYRFVYGSYKKNVKQRIDPVGVQLDFLFKITKSEIRGNSNFFGTVGFDLSTKTVSFENTYSEFDTASFISRNPDTTIRGGGSPLPPKNLNFKKPVYNFNVGLMWVLDADDVNIKAQLNGGISKFWEPLIIYTRSGQIIYQIKSKPYVQIRMFATYKPIGVSFGFESFVRREEFPQFNFTLSKVFDLRHFLKTLSPVSSLNLK